MANTPTTIIDETIAAARGVASLLVGDRRAASHFDFSARGLAGSFIALLVAVALGAYLPLPVDDGSGAGAGPSSAQAVLVDGAIFGVQLGVAALLLRLLKRQDGFVPYVVVGNWANFFAGLAAIVLTLVGVAPEATVIFMGLAVVVFEINAARLIITLSPRQIVVFLGGQIILLGVAALIVLGAPPTGGPAA